MDTTLAVKGTSLQEFQIKASVEQSILAALTDAMIADVDAPCGGKGRCGKCFVTVSGPVRSVETGVLHQAKEESLLACRFMPAGSCTITLPAAEDLHVMTEGAGDIRGNAGTGLGAAIDIGTTTVAVLLYDLHSGKRLGSSGARNAQRSYGADVISRITACTEGKLPVLKGLIQQQITEIITSLCEDANRSVSQVERIVIAGNTVMEHLFAGLDPTGIGIAPFTPASLFGDHRQGSIGSANVYLCPCISGYVGGDITAGLLASGGDRAKGLLLYIDIGTNGEMALGDRNGYLACATAAGPAFEGAEIACGMDGSPGAIDRIRVKNGGIEVHVIGEGSAIGLCGSGLIDAVAALLELGVIDETGRMATADELSSELASRLFQLKDGMAAFRLDGNAYLSAKDVRQVQLAKAAIRAGAETLLSRSGKTADDVTELVIAGGFGSFMDKNSALRIGLLPQVDSNRIRHVGNAASAGAALALTQAGEVQLAAFAKTIEYLELSTAQDFMDRYIDCMMFGEDIS